MGILLSGHYGHPPEAESGTISLQDAALRLGLKPSDFVSHGDPAFFKEAFGSRGRYLLFRVAGEEVLDSPVWKVGYYLLPLEASDVLATYEKNKRGLQAAMTETLPFQIESKTEPPPEILAQAKRWAVASQPLFFKCGCPELVLRLDAPWGLRFHWKVRLRCPKKCQPALSTTL